jgi:hypothetical protein
MITGYRYDTEDRADEEIVRQTSDHVDRLTDARCGAERLIRAAREDGESIRANSVYSYLDRDFAEFAWRYRKGTHLYEVEIDDADVVHKADLDSYTAVEEAHGKGEATAEHVARYWAGATEGRRVEILATQVRVVRKLKDNSDH